MRYASKHLRVLKEAGLVELRRRGTFHEYTVSSSWRRCAGGDSAALDLGCCRFRFDKLPE